MLVASTFVLSLLIFFELFARFWGTLGVPERCDDNAVQVASLLDLAAQKMKVILVRAEAKDYLDIYTLLNAGITLPQALGAAKALYPELNPVLSLKALSYYGEPALTAVARCSSAVLDRSSRTNPGD